MSTQGIPRSLLLKRRHPVVSGVFLRGWILVVAASMMLVPTCGWACACGCGVFEVGTRSLLPTQEGGLLFVQYDFVNQNQHWHGTSVAPAESTDDQELRTHFVTVGVQYMMSAQWGFKVEAPFWSRGVKRMDETGTLTESNFSSLGDLRLEGVFSGLAPDMSTGVRFGVKVPTGDSTNPYADRDTQIGTGSTDLLAGFYHLERLTSDGRWAFFGNVQWSQPMWFRGDYRPGAEGNLMIGCSFAGWSWGGVGVGPLIQVIGTYRNSDGGAEAMPGDTGYQRVLVVPGVEVELNHWRVYADVGMPVFQNVIGNQLVASPYLKVNLGTFF